MSAIRPRLLAIAAAAIALTALTAPAPASASAGLRAGAGRADITPPTGYYLMGWVRSDAKSQGQLTRLFARSLVLERNGRKLALVAADLGFVPAGLVADVVERLADRGFGEESVIISASHTHSAPAGYANYAAFNTVAPTSTTPTAFELGSPADPQLYTFLVRRIATAIRRADRDRAPVLPAGARPSSSASPRTARSRRTSPTTTSCASSARALPRKTPMAPSTRSTRR